MNINSCNRASNVAKNAVAFGLSALLFAPVLYADTFPHRGDFGLQVEHLLEAQSESLFGFQKALTESAPPTTGAYRTSSQKATDQVLLAKGLKVDYLTRNAAELTDMMAFFPAEKPTHLVTCVEGAPETLTNGKRNPAVQRINLKTGDVATILRGMSRCDGIRTTPWGTILATEETGDGSAYEIFNPFATTEVTITARNGCGAAATIASSPGSNNVIKRIALPCMAWEGLIIQPSGVVIAGDELRPGTGVANSDGGAIFKFLPAMPRIQTGPITDLSQSPLAAGATFAMQVSCNGDNQQFGQGCEVGNAAWLAVNPTTARGDANAKGATGFYRPEDLEQDPNFTDPDNADAIRFCWTNTQEEDAGSFGEVMCGIDAAPLVAAANSRTVLVYRFVEGDEDFNSFDNLAFQPKTGNLYVIEDHDNGDIFACLPDGADRDIKSDGCLKILSVKDSSAEPTGFVFDPSGTTAYLSIQHSDDAKMPLVDGYRTDDILKITGFKLRRNGNLKD
jgi:hypothetical protein